MAVMSIRKYKERDFLALCEIFLRAVKETARRDYSAQQVAAWAQIDEATWRQKLATSEVHVAVVDEQPVGFISVIGNHIDLLFVAPEFNGQGVAGRLLKPWIARGKVLTVDASITAKPFFERQGFQVVAQQKVECRGEWFINYRMQYNNVP
nr:GNAT family N-acetyltransferase [Citrobacter farmeri]